jgi:hypothetical protein
MEPGDDQRSRADEAGNDLRAHSAPGFRRLTSATGIAAPPGERLLQLLCAGPRRWEFF